MSSEPNDRIDIVSLINSDSVKLEQLDAILRPLEDGDRMEVTGETFENSLNELSESLIDGQSIPVDYAVLGIIDRVLNPSTISSDPGEERHQTCSLAIKGQNEKNLDSLMKGVLKDHGENTSNHHHEGRGLEGAYQVSTQKLTNSMVSLKLSSPDKRSSSISQGASGSSNQHGKTGGSKESLDDMDIYFNPSK